MERSKKCFEGDMNDHVLAELEKLEEEEAKALKKAEQEREELLNTFLETEAQIKKENKEALEGLDFGRDLYFVKNVTKTNKKAYKVIFDGFPEYKYIAFAETNSKAIAQGHKYVRNKYYPAVAYKDCPVSIRDGRAYRMQALDKFAIEGQVPIPTLLKEGIEFACSGCGKVHFNYQDYVTKRCYIVESEGDIVPYAKGMIFCYSCYNKYFNN